ncbi:MAG: hypothetical protein PVI03_04665 [Candidatus Thorarchaeota archaeon]|jgi:hypothetical protein
MADFPNLPGTYTELTDGNLQIVEVSTDPVVAVLGTAAQGTADVIYPVTRPADAANAFGASGTLIRGMYETRFGGAQNVVLMRIAAKTAKLLHVGDDAGENGITIETFDKDASAGTDLYIFWDHSEERLVVTDEDDTVLYEMIKDEIITDLGYVYTSGTAESVGSDIGTESVPILMSSVTVTGTRFVAGSDGVDATAMELYEALHKAYASLEASQLDFMVPMDVYMDTPNVADDSSIAASATMSQVVATGGETTIDLEHSRVNPNSLYVLYDSLGGGSPVRWEWGTDFWFNAGAGTGDVDQIEFASALTASDTVDISYNYLTTDGLLYYRTWEESGETMFEWWHEKYKYDFEDETVYEYHEANFAWQLANFCYNLSKNDNNCIGTIGVRPFRSTALKDLANWAGSLPTYDANDAVTTNGTGLAGNRWMAGKLMTVNTYTWEDNDSLTPAATDTFDLGHSDVVAGSVSVLVDDTTNRRDFTISPGTGGGGVDQIIFENAMTGGETTIIVTYYYISAQTTTQRGPGFNATSDEVADGTPLSPNVDIGRYISVVMAWPILFTPVDATGFGYIATGAPVYAGFVAQLAPHSAPTNKVIPGIASAFRLSKSRMDDLVSVHYVVFTPRERGTIVVDAPTAATSSSDYTRLTTVRIVAETIDRLRDVLNPFLGEGITTPQLNAMQTTTDRVLTDLIKEGYLQRAEASVSASAVERVQGKANLDLLLVPAFELRQIFITVSLSAI